MGSWVYPDPLPRPPAIYQEGQTGGPSQYRRKGMDYLASIGPSLQRLSLGGERHKYGFGHSRKSSYDKPLPALPSSHTPARPPANAPSEYPPQLVSYRQWTPPRLPPRPTTEYLAPAPQLLFPPSAPVHRPISVPIIPPSVKSTPVTPIKKKVKKKERRKSGHTIIDLSLSSSESSAEDSEASVPRNITPRSADRRKRATSEQPIRTGLLTPVKPAPRRIRQHSVSPGRSDSPTRGGGAAVRCSGFTRTGAPCKRLVKVAAPYLASLDTNVPTQSGGDVVEEAGLGRYCKDHAGMICESSGFYSKEKRGLWIDFEDWIPPALGQQTQTLLRMAMESKLTAKESPGFIYAYELRDLQTPTTCYYKVGRTDNVPRRIGEWTKSDSKAWASLRAECQSHSPTLRDIYPTPSASNGHTQITASFLPGAMQSGTIATGDPSLAVKRWERLIHLELSEISSRDRDYQFKKLREKCGDCGTCHREIFALPREEGSDAQGSYEVVREVIERWERFVKVVCGV